MPYLPKSQYQIKYTNGGLLQYTKDNTEYIGKYIKTSTNQYIAGTKLSGETLMPIKKLSTNIDTNYNAVFFTNANSDIYDDLKIKENIPSTKPQPTEKDYEKGFFTRFWIEKANEPNIIFETSQKNVTDFKNKLDGRLYHLNTIRWELKGENASYNNQQNIKVYQRDLPYIHSIFPQPDEYVKIDDDNKNLKMIKQNHGLDEIPTFTLEQWNMFDSLDKEKLIIKYGEVNISDL